MFASRTILVAAGLFALVLLPSLSSAQDVFLGKAAEHTPLGQVDHTAWAELLQRYVNEEGMVDYRGWQANQADVAKLDAYLNTLAGGDPSAPASTADKIAFWSNAYNAVTVKGILREYPTTSIRNHTAKLWGYNIWKNLKLNVGGKPINLNDIEHEVLRKLGDHRIHFAIVCASIGCPRLLNDAYVPERLDEQLDTNARHFFTQPRNFRVDGANNTVYLSSILSWFDEDFGANQQEQLKTISRYIEGSSAQRLLNSGRARVSYLDYDWGINEQ